jgi:hypothetical protein
MTDGRLPIECQIDKKRLTSLEAKIDLVLDNQQKLISIDGPIGRVRDEVHEVASVAKAAHERLDSHEQIIKDIGGRQWQIVWKVAGGVMGGGGILVLLVKMVESFSP